MLVVFRIRVSVNHDIQNLDTTHRVARPSDRSVSVVLLKSCDSFGELLLEIRVVSVLAEPFSYK